MMLNQIVIIVCLYSNTPASNKLLFLYPKQVILWMVEYYIIHASETKETPV